MIKSLPISLGIGRAYAFAGIVDGEEPSSNITQIITHTDLDGYAAAAVVYDAIPDADREIEIGHYDYDCAPKINPNAGVLFILDYSISNPEFAKSVLDAMNRNVHVFWIDHHATSLSMLEEHPEFELLKFCPGIRNVNYCATYLAWEFMHRGTPVPTVIKLVDDFDCWKKKMPSSEYLNNAFYNFRFSDWNRDPKSPSWAELFHENSEVIGHTQGSDTTDPWLLTVMLEYGKQYTSFIQDYYYSNAHAKAFVAPLTKFPDLEDEVVILFTDTPGSQMFSDLFKSVDFPDGKYKIALCIRYGINGASCSVYSHTSACITAEEICKAYGGGGHPGAAGFTLKYGDPLPFVRNKVQKLSALNSGK